MRAGSLAAAVLTLWCLLPAAVIAQEDAPRVLVLNSYHLQYAWTRDLVTGIREELAYLPEEHLHIEFMDARRMVDDPAHLSMLAALFAHKYVGELRPDLIISSDDSALAFLLERRDTLFSDVPIVFCGINSRTVEELEPVPNVTGILEGLPVAENLALLEQIHPDARRIVLIADGTWLGQGMVRVARAELPRFERPSRRIEIWDDFTLRELDQRVAEVDESTVFLLLAIHADREGHYFSFDEHLGPLTEHSGAPIYGMFGMLLDNGVTGGMMNDANEHGRAAAVIARRVLAGTPADAIPVVPSAEYLPRFHYARLQRYGIPESVLPPGSEVRGRPISFYERHAALVWAVGLIILGLVLAVLWLVRLVRRMKHAERELVQKQAELRRAQQLEVIGRLAGGVAHDFNNLITVISGFAMIASRRAPAGDAMLRESLEQIERATERAAGLTRQLLAVARKQPIQPRVLDVNALVVDMHKLLRRLISEAVELVVLPASEPACVRVDPGQLEQVLSNLAINARDAMPEGGTLTIAVAASEHEVVIRTTDTGTGMSDEVRARIFEPFYTTKEVGKGTGLGLATSRSIVEQAGGSIAVESVVGQGTTFSVTLPRAHERPQDAEERPAAPPSVAGEGLVLLVEDDPQVRRFVRTALEEHGFEIVEADNGGAALTLARRHAGTLRCVVTDVVMPILGGSALVRRLRAEIPSIPVVVMSGYVDDPSLLGEVSDLGVRFIAKPFVPEALVAMVSEAAASSRARAAADLRNQRAPSPS